MSITASANIGGNIAYARSSYFKPPQFEDISEGGIKPSRPEQALEIPESGVAKAIISKGEAFGLAEEVRRLIAAKPVKINLKIHQFQVASLLGSNYV